MVFWLFCDTNFEWGAVESNFFLFMVFWIRDMVLKRGLEASSQKKTLEAVGEAHFVVFF